MRRELASTGTYTALAEIGRGGMGVVYLARAQGHGGFARFVVLKRMHAELTRDPRQVERFVDEARIASSVHHANVVGVQHVGEDEAGVYLVLDYVEGVSLDDLVIALGAEGIAIPPGVIARIFLDALAGIAAIHEARDDAGNPLGILHRDISPQNLLVGLDGTTRVMDFGIAKSVASKARTKTGSIVGKALYMAPEYLTGRPFDHRIDIYAIGISLWSLLAGQEPWPDAEEPQILVLATTRGVPHLHDVAPHVSADLAEVTMAGSSASPEHRYASARAMASALERAIGPDLASSATVAELVARHFGEKIAARRRAVPLQPRPQPPATEEASAPPSAASPVTIATDDFVIPLRKRKRLVMPIAIAASVAIAATIGVVVLRSSATAPSAAPPASASTVAPPETASAPAPPPPIASDAPPASPPPPSSTKPSRVAPAKPVAPPPVPTVPLQINPGNPYR